MLNIIFNSLHIVVCGILILATVQGSPVGANVPQKAAEIIRYAKSAEMHNYLNESHNPCENFYNFVCSNYYKMNPPTIQSARMQPIVSIASAMKRKYLALLKAPSDGSTPEIERKVKSFFASCMATSVTSESYRAQIKEILSEFGGMPALEGNNWNEGKFDWLETVATINNRYGLNIILGLSVGHALDDKSVNRVSIKVQEMPLPSVETYTDKASESLRSTIKRVMARYLQRDLGLGENKALDVAGDVMFFETKLFASTKNDEDDEEESEEDEEIPASDSQEISQYISNYTTFEKINLKYYKDFDVKRFVNISFGYVPTSMVTDEIEDDFQHIADVTQHTAKSIVANYIFYYLLHALTLSVHDSKMQEQDCLLKTKEYFGNVLDSMVYREYATKQTEQDVNQMWQVIRSTFEDVLQSNKLHWMRQDTRQVALAKLRSVKFEINAYQQMNFTEKFAQLEINDHDYFKNVKSILSFNAFSSRNKLHEPPQPYDDFNVLAFTPAYILNENRIKVPVGILQPYHLWSDYYPKALQFGTLGFLVAHELIHGFDADGRFFDKSGDVKKWWDKDSSSYFRNQTECFANQYENFIRLNTQPLESQSENIADNGAIRLAYIAYTRWYENALRNHQSTDWETLPRLNYTNRQLFFISYGQFFCNANHKLVEQMMTAGDTHAHYKLRVMVPLANLDEFSKEFKCPKGTKMNPKKKCSIY